MTCGIKVVMTNTLFLKNDINHNIIFIYFNIDKKSYDRQMLQGPCLPMIKYTCLIYRT